MPRHLKFVKTYDANELAVTPRFELWEDDLLIASYTGEGYNFSIIQGFLLGSWYQQEYGELMGNAFDFQTVQLILAGSGCQLLEAQTRKSGGEVAYIYAIQQDYPSLVEGMDEDDEEGDEYE